MKEHFQKYHNQTIHALPFGTDDNSALAKLGTQTDAQYCVVL